jgi:surface-anchored protein
MNPRPFPAVAALLAAVAISSLSVPALAADITFDTPVPGKTGAADLTFYFNSASGTAGAWVTTFRNGSTNTSPATANAFPLNSPFSSGTWTGIVGNVVPSANGNQGDYTFNTLTTNVFTTKQVQVGTTNYFVSTAGSGTNASPNNPSTSTPDLGIRTRLRENQDVMGTGTNTAANQFDSFNLTLRLADSTFNGNPLGSSGAFVSLLGWNNFGATEVLIDSAANDLTANFGNYAHVHRNWGFSQYGTYNLAFDLQGVDGQYGATAAVGTTTIGFVAAVPEPGTVSLAALGLLGAAGGFRWLRRRGRPAVSEAPAESLDA